MTKQVQQEQPALQLRAHGFALADLSTGAVKATNVTRSAVSSSNAQRVRSSVRAGSVLYGI